MLHRLFDLTGKTALVTGGSKGLGKAIARGLVEAGADIVISSRHEDELRSALSEILGGTSRKGSYVVADMTCRDDVHRLARQSLELNGRIDILVNNAGSNIPQPFDQITDEAWDQLLELNLTSIMVLCRDLIPQMKERRWGPDHQHYLHSWFHLQLPPQHLLGDQGGTDRHDAGSRD